MLSCNLAEIVLNKWLQQFGNKGNNLYIAILDDFVKALMQVLKYYQYFKDEYVGTDPNKEELMLQVVQCLARRSRNPKVLNVAIVRIPGADKFCTCKPHFKNEEVFSS